MPDGNFDQQDRTIHGQSGFKVHPIGFDPTGASRIGPQRGADPSGRNFFFLADPTRFDWGRANRAHFRQIGRSDSDCPCIDRTKREGERKTGRRRKVKARHSWFGLPFLHLQNVSVVNVLEMCGELGGMSSGSDVDDNGTISSLCISAAPA